MVVGGGAKNLPKIYVFVPGMKYGKGAGFVIAWFRCSRSIPGGRDWNGRKAL